MLQLRLAYDRKTCTYFNTQRFNLTRYTSNLKEGFTSGLPFKSARSLKGV